MTNVRKATAQDIDILYDLILGIAEYHDQTAFVSTSKAELLAAGFSETPKFGALLVEYNQEVVGYVSYTFNYSIWLGDTYLNIDDVFVKAAYRGKQLGEALMLGIKELCLEAGIKKVRWEVQADNAGAIKFYKRLGAKFKEKGIFIWKF